MKKSTYTLIISFLFILVFITIYFIDTKIHKENIREQIMNSYHARQTLDEMNIIRARNIKSIAPEKWKEYTQQIHNLNQNYLVSNKLTKNFYSTSVDFVTENDDYILNNYKKFNDTTTLKQLEKVHHNILQSKEDFEDFQNYYTTISYAEVLYELGKIKQAQEIEKKYHKDEYQKIPRKVKTWIDSELAKITQKPIKDLNSPEFFNNTPGRIVGYIKGYNGNQVLDFTTGMFYAEDIFKQASTTPAMVTIHPDGRFEADLPLNHPKYSKIIINGKWISFYLEPGQTLGMVIDSEGLYSNKPRKNGFKNTLFLGNLAEINYDLINYNHEDFNYNNIDKKTQEFSYDDYKKYRQQQLQYNLENYQTYVTKRQITTKTARILKNTILVDNAVYLFDFLQHHPTDVLLEPLNKIYKPNAKDDFYTFLKTIPWNDQSLLLADQFSTFINRFEYMDRLQIINTNGITKSHYIETLIKSWKAKDSIIQNTFDMDARSFIYNVSKVRTLNFACEFINNEKVITKYWNTIKTTNNPILNNKSQQIINQYYTQKEQGVEIPNTKAGAILKKIIAPYKGKTIFLKIWANNGIHMFESQLKNTINPINKKYKNEVAFVYLTEEDKYLKDRYTVFVKEHNLTNSYRISEDEMNNLRQLFKKANSNFTVFINKEAKIMNSDFQLNNYNIQTVLEKTTAKK